MFYYLQFESSGDNFIGEIYRILYKDGNDSENEKQSSLILKIAPRNLQRRKKLRLRELFLREIDMYDQVSFMLKLEENKILKYKCFFLSYYRFYHISLNFNYPKE